MTFKEVLSSSFTEVWVKSYGYETTGVFGGFEPFGSSGRLLRFKIDRVHRELVHKWLHFDDEDQELYEVKEGKLTCLDPELWAAPEHD